MLRDGYKYEIKKQLCKSCHLLSHCHKVIMSYDEYKNVDENKNKNDQNFRPIGKKYGWEWVC